MYTISVTKESNFPEASFSVRVTEGEEVSDHVVTLTEAYWEHLRAGRDRPEILIKESFEFLLEREPKEAILSSFDLAEIQRYFPEYEEEIIG